MGALERLQGVASDVMGALSNWRSGDFPTQALGETIPSLALGWYYGQAEMDLLGQRVTYGELYRRQPAVAAVVDKRADAVARLDVRVWSGGEVVESGPLVKLMHRPYDRMTRHQWLRWLSSTVDIYGEAFLLKVRGADGMPWQLVPMTPVRTTVHRDPDSGRESFTFNLGVASAGLLTATEDDVVALRRYNPDGPTRGLSRLESLRATLQNEEATRRAQYAFWRRGARPGAVITHPATLSQVGADRISAQFQALYGGADKAGGTPVLDEGMDIKMLQLNMEEMQYVEGRKLNLEEVCMRYDVAPATIHALLEKASFTSSVEQMRSLYRDSMPPHLADLEEALTAYVASDFGDGYSCRFDTSDMMRGDFETRAQTIPGLVTSGVFTPNEARPYFDLPVLDDPVADVLYANAATQPLGTPVGAAALGVPAGPSAPTPDDPSAPTPDDPAGPSSDGTSAPEVDHAAAINAAVQDMTGEAVKSYRITDRAAAMSGRIRAKSSTADMRAEAAKAQLKAVRAVLQEQSDAISGAFDTYGELDDDVDPDELAGDLFDPTEWDDQLAESLHDPSAAAVHAFGTRSAAALGGTFVAGMVKNWVQANVDNAASNINAATAAGLSDAIASVLGADSEDVRAAIGDRLTGFLDDLTGARSEQIAETRATSLSNFGANEGARQAGGRTKTWVTADPRARPSHLAMNGETVGMDEEFSLGGMYPGDPSMGADEVAGCTCYLDFGNEGE